MPRRMKKIRSRRASDPALERMREAIAAGYPWRYADGRVFGYFDLLLMTKGYSYGFEDFITQGDEESKRALWEDLRGDILSQHVKLRPGTRPWAWWQYDKPELRRLLRIDPDLLACDEGRIFEDDLEYLTRLCLLTDTEKEIFEKFGDVEFVRVSSGKIGECEPCWQQAKAIAAEIAFDLDRVSFPYSTFWVPEDLLFDCEHCDFSSGGIFSIDYIG